MLINKDSTKSSSSSSSSRSMLNAPLAVGLVAALSLTSSAGLAQGLLSGERADPSLIPVRIAALQPAVGERVVDEYGVVDSAFFTENRICTVRGCRVFIFDKRTGALILKNGVWSEAYSRTDRGFEVIRVKAFAAKEIPSSETPSDAPLDTAPSIRKVARSAPERNE